MQVPVGLFAHAFLVNLSQCHCLDALAACCQSSGRTQAAVSVGAALATTVDPFCSPRAQLAARKQAGGSAQLLSPLQPRHIHGRHVP